MMVEARPSTPLVVPEPDFLLELLIIALDSPSQFREIDKSAEGHVLINSGEPIFRGLGLSDGPFDQQRFFASCASAPHRRSAHPNAGKARAKPIVRSLPPSDRVPSMVRQLERQLLDAQARPRRTALGGSTHFNVRHDRCHVFEPQGADAGAQGRVRAVTSIQQYRTAPHARRAGRPDLLQRDLLWGHVLSCDEPCLWPISAADKAGTRSASWHDGWRSTRSQQPGNWLVCQAARSTDGARRPTWSRTSEKTYRR